MSETQSKTKGPFHRPSVLVVSCLLVTEIALFYTMPTSEYIPTPPPLKTFQTTAGPWQMARETQIESEVQAFLKADDTLSRQYGGGGGPGPIDLFVAFFKTQRAGVTPHSPKVCLPGAGWTPETSSIVDVPVPGETDPIPVNRYVVRHGQERSLVMYWYQAAHRVVASEYMAKLYLMMDALRYRRSDEAMIRVIVPITAQEDEAERTARQFIGHIYAPLKQQMWR
jgi:EpsI family protein